jgi:hypothetical protein
MSAFTPAQIKAADKVADVLADHPEFIQSVGLLNFAKIALKAAKVKA